MTNITYNQTTLPIKAVIWTFSTALTSQADPDTFKSNPTLAVGDVKVSIDGGAFANLTTLPSASGTVVTVSLSAAEMNGDVILVQFSDAAGAEWQDSLIEIRTIEALVGSATYCTIADLKAYLGISGTSDDTLLTNLIARAQKAIEVYCRRVFKCAADTTRYFTVGVDTEGDSLWFDEDLCQLGATTPVITDADGTPVSLTRNTDFVTVPRNTTPWYGLKILPNSNYYWDYTGNPEMGITVSGRWAYSVTPPDDILHACLRLAGYFYRQKDSQVFDVTAIPDAGVMTVPQGLPKDVRMILDNYKKATL